MRNTDMHPNNRYADNPRQAAADQEAVEYARNRAAEIGAEIRALRAGCLAEYAGGGFAAAEFRDFADRLGDLSGILSDDTADAFARLENEITDALGAAERAAERAEDTEHYRLLRRDYHHLLGLAR